MAGPEEQNRGQFEYQILNDMRCPTFDFQAFNSVDDLKMARREIKDEARAKNASAFRLIFRIPTLVGPGTFSSPTEIGVSIDVPDYPLQPPLTWIMSSVAPWSPHFRAGAPVCIGEEYWLPRNGHVTVGNLAVHLAYLLNWDEKGRGPGYVGWNGEAIAYHKQAYRGKPLDPTIIYPLIPTWLSGTAEADMTFDIVSHAGPAMVFERLT